MLPIEAWANEQDLPREARDMLDEAILCYKVGAYRASMVFSYLAWSAAIRGRLLAARAPTNYPAAKWVALMKRLRNDDDRDAAMFEATQSKAPSPIFGVSDDLRDQVKYWKNRRNDCAHSKTNEIDAAYTETFWLFFRSNYGGFAVIGSAEELLARIRAHFDPNVTPPDTPCDALVRAIPGAIQVAHLDTFCDEFHESMNPVGTTPSAKLVRLLRGNRNEIRFIRAVFAHGTIQTCEAFGRMIEKHRNLHRRVLTSAPALHSQVPGSPAIVRSMWRKQGGARLLANLLRVDAIPQAEFREANNHVILESLGPPELSAIDDQVLGQAGFWQEFELLAFTKSKIDEFGWSNDNRAFIVWYLQTHPLSDVAVKAICGVFSGTPYPTRCKDALEAFFKSSTLKRTEFRTIAARIGATLPPDLPSLC